MINIFRVTSFFDNNQANLICDEICNLITPKENSFPENLMLTGMSAFIKQTGKVYKDPENIVFKTQDMLTYLELSKKLEVLPIRNLLKYQSHLMFNYLAGNIDLCFIIELDLNESKTVVIDGVIMEDQNLISKIYL